MSKPNNLRIYFQDEHLVVIEKPAGFQVHTPEHYLLQGKVLRRNNVLQLLKKQLERPVFTVHRLDGATSGVMMFSLSSEIAGAMQEKFKAREVKKTYVAMVRGWTEDSGTIDSPLSSDTEGKAALDARTEYETLARVEIPHAVGRYEQSRYSLVKVHPITGRRHQIRRHFKAIFHPLVGDSVHGDSQHNRLWRKLLRGPGGEQNHLFLKAYSLEFLHPETEVPLKFSTRWNHRWLRMFSIANVCPFLP